jgi:hypothetical protein
MYSITPFTTGNDEAAPVGSNNVRVGKFTHPSTAPSNDLLVVWTPGPANDLNRPTTLPYYDAGLYLMRGGNVVTNPSQLVLIRNDPAYNEAWPRAVVPWRGVHGTDEPARLAWLPNDGSAHADLPRGTPHGLVAGRSDYQPWDLTRFVTLLTKNASNETVLKTNAIAGAHNVEFLRDIRPLLQRSCNSCHTTNNPTPPGDLALDDYGNYSGVPGDYARLARDTSARWGYKPVIGSRTWRQSNASRYVRPFQSRRSLLVWKIFGRRLDGWTNADHPTESVPGDPATLPPGANPNAADLDYTGDIMPPPGSAVPTLSEDEKMTFARWVDLGCPINTGSGAGTNYGWHLDDLRPTLAVSSPRQNRNEPPLTEIRIGVADAYSGISNGTLSVKADFPVNGLAAGTEIAGQGSFIAPGIFSIPLNPAISNLPSSHLTATVLDAQGNRTTSKVRFHVAPSTFRILSLDAARLEESRLDIRFENPDALTGHGVVWGNALEASATWSPLAILGAESESNRVRRLEVQTPSAAARGFLRVRQP